MTYFGIALVILGIFALAGIIYVQLDKKHLKTKKALVNHALKELVSKKKRKNLLKMEGAVEWAGDLNKMRKSRT